MADIFYHAVPTDWRREQKYRFLEDKESVANIEWQKLQPDKNQNWLTEGVSDEFESFLPMGSKEGGEETIFKLVSNGVKTNRDVWAWNFNRDELAANTKRMRSASTAHRLAAA
jgi:predicted helicase